RRGPARGGARAAHLEGRWSRHHPADAQTEGLGFQRRHTREEGVSDFEDDFGEMPDATAATSTSSAQTLTFADFVAYAPSRMCIYLPCKAPWPNASVDRRLPEQLLLDASGNPVLNKKGKVVLIPASEWLEKNQSVEAMTWAPGAPEFVRN